MGDAAGANATRDTDRSTRFPRGAHSALCALMRVLHSAQGVLSIFLEYCAGGSISSLLEKFGPFNEARSPSPPRLKTYHLALFIHASCLPYLLSSSLPADSPPQTIFHPLTVIAAFPSDPHSVLSKDYSSLCLVLLCATFLSAFLAPTLPIGLRRLLTLSSSVQLATYLLSPREVSCSSA
eukprot:5792548-Pleurochrysis_carterae.AAC.2